MTIRPSSVTQERPALQPGRTHPVIRSLDGQIGGKGEDVDHESAPGHRRTLGILAIATAIGSLGLAAGGTAGALLGADLIGRTAGAGIPVGLLAAGSAVAALIVSAGTSRVGRGSSLALGYLFGAIGATLVISATMTNSVATLLIGSTVLGAGNAAIFLTRYAAAELSAEASRGQSLGMVLLATAVGAAIGPVLLGPTGDLASILGLPAIAGLYLVAILSFVASGSILASALPPNRTGTNRVANRPAAVPARRVTVHEIAIGLSSTSARLAILVLVTTNLVMVGIMTITPVHLLANGHSLGVIGAIVGVHVAGMFAPSPISGWAADRFGAIPVVVTGAGLIVVAGVAGTLIDPGNVLLITLVLVALGLGWNGGVVGGSTLLVRAVPMALRPHAEGVGEMTMGLGAIVGGAGAGAIASVAGFGTLFLAGAAVAVVVGVILSVARPCA